MKYQLLIILIISLNLISCGGTDPQSPTQPNSLHPPTDITLSATSIAENITQNTIVGTLTTTDIDSNNHTYTVSDARFEVVESELRLKANNSLDHEDTKTISIEITTTDENSNNYTETFIITVIDVNESPIDINLDALSVAENNEGAIIGNIYVTDPDIGDTFSYALSDTRFEVVGEQLKLNNGVILDYEAETSISLDITATDSGELTYTKNFTISITDVDDANLSGFIISGLNATDYSGYSVGGLGDVNNDGLDDFIISATGADPNGSESAGVSYVIFGTDMGFGASFDLDTLNGTNGFKINGEGTGDRSGRTVSSAGDINNDSIDDIIIGSNNQKAYVIFGSEQPFSADIDLANLNGENGFEIYTSYDFSYELGATDLGRAVSNLGDINGDGIDDIIVGASAMTNRKGESYVIFGSNDSFGSSYDVMSLDATNGFVIRGGNEADYSGVSVSKSGDVNGDGINDILIGAYYAEPSVGNANGVSYVVYGSSQGGVALFELSTLDGSNGFAINGVSPRDHSGVNVSGAGDVNGDGLSDIMIGAISDNVGYVVFGSNQGSDAEINLADLDGSNGFYMTSSTAPNGTQDVVSNAGDINGDGIDDFIFSDQYTYVVFGTKEGFPANLHLSSLDGTNGFKVDTLQFRNSASAAGDVNGDGIDDIIIGSIYSSPGGQSYVIFGHSGTWKANYNIIDLN